MFQALMAASETKQAAAERKLRTCRRVRAKKTRGVGAMTRTQEKHLQVLTELSAQHAERLAWSADRETCRSARSLTDSSDHATRTARSSKEARPAANGLSVAGWLISGFKEPHREPHVEGGLQSDRKGENGPATAGRSHRSDMDEAACRQRIHATYNDLCESNRIKL